MRGLLLTLVKLVLVVGIVLVMAHVIMSALGVDVEGLKDILNIEEEASCLRVAYAAEKEPMEGEIQAETYCVFYDGEEIYTVKTVLTGTVFSAPIVEKEGYTFKGWRNGDSVQVGNLMAEGSVMIFHAEWQLNIYTVTYYDLEGNVLATLEASIHSNVTSFQAPEIADREFLGWYNAADAEDPLSSDYKVTSDLVLIPQYSEIRATFFLFVVPELILEAELSAVITMLLLVAYVVAFLFIVFIIAKSFFRFGLFILAKLHRWYYSMIYDYVQKRLDKDKPVSDRLFLKARYFVEMYASEADEALEIDSTLNEVQP